MNDPVDTPDDAADPIAEAGALLRNGYRGTLQFDEHFIPLKYVIDPADGRLIAPVMVAMLTAAETILFVPEEAEDSLQMLVSLEEIEEHHAMADRWRTYHGEPEDVRWAAIWIDMAKLRGVVVDGNALMTANVLAGAEPALCKFANENTDALRAAADRFGGMEIESPRCVGVDTQGMDVRAKFDIVRIWFDEPAADAAAARATIERMFAEARS